MWDEDERNIVQTIKRRNANWTGHTLCRNCLAKHIIEGKIEGRIEETGRWGRRRKQLLGGLKEKRIGYCELKEEALYRILSRIRFVRAYGPVVRRTTEWINCMCQKYAAALIYEFKHSVWQQDGTPPHNFFLECNLLIVWLEGTYHNAACLTPHYQLKPFWWRNMHITVHVMPIFV